MTTLTPEELAVIYHEANGLTTNQLAPITTARVFNAMLAVDAHARQQSAEEIAALKAQVEGLRSKYDDLLFCVSRKHPGETLHDTAKRYLLERESPNASQASHRTGGREMTDKVEPEIPT